VNQQWNAVIAVEQLGGSVDYVWRLDEQVHPLPGFMRFPRSVGWAFPGDSRVDGVNLTGCQRTELDDTLRHLLTAAELRSLSLANAGISDASLDAIAGQSRLEVLDLYGTPITDTGLRQYIPQLKHLRHLDVRQTNITRSGWLHVREKLPDIWIRSDFEE
jgi:Leucine-rich repeat (LRR) protein